VHPVFISSSSPLSSLIWVHAAPLLPIFDVPALMGLIFLHLFNCVDSLLSHYLIWIILIFFKGFFGD
jgi:hypothetical protein